MGVKLGLLTVRLRMFENMALRKVGDGTLGCVWNEACNVNESELQLFLEIQIN